MSEQGWRDFLNAEDLQDWVVLHGGPTAVPDQLRRARSRRI